MNAIIKANFSRVIPSLFSLAFFRAASNLLNTWKRLLACRRYWVAASAKVKQHETNWKAKHVGDSSLAATLFFMPQYMKAYSHIFSLPLTTSKATGSSETCYRIMNEIYEQRDD